MRADRVASMVRYAVAVDCETHQIQPGLLAPPMVCVSFAWADGRTALHGGTEDDKRIGLALFAEILLDDRAIIVGANIAYDMLVLANEAAKRGQNLVPFIIAAYDADRVFDVQQCEALHAIAQGTHNLDPRKLRAGVPEKHAGLKDPVTGKDGRYSLLIVTDLVLGRIDAKANDEWRLRYFELDGIPISEWPETARTYPVDDVLNTVEVGLSQAGHLPCTATGWLWPMGQNLTGEIVRARLNMHAVAEEGRNALWLHFDAAWGLRSDKVAIDILEEAAMQGQPEGELVFIGLGYLREGKEKGERVVSENRAAVQRAVALAYGCKAPCEGECQGAGKVRPGRSKRDGVTPVGAWRGCHRCGGTGLALTDAGVPRNEPTDVMLEKDPKCPGSVKAGRDQLMESGDEDLIAYAQFGEDAKILETYIPALRLMQDSPRTLRPNTPLVTLRVSYSGPEQTFPRQVSARLQLKLKKICARRNAEMTEAT